VLASATTALGLTRVPNDPNLVVTAGIFGGNLELRAWHVDDKGIIKAHGAKAAGEAHAVAIAPVIGQKLVTAVVGGGGRLNFIEWDVFENDVGAVSINRMSQPGTSVSQDPVLQQTLCVAPPFPQNHVSFTVYVSFAAVGVNTDSNLSLFSWSYIWPPQ